jgi:hypothetical protein
MNATTETALFDEAEIVSALQSFVSPMRLLFLMVLRRESGGVWRIAREVLSAEVPATRG